MIRKLRLAALGLVLTAACGGQGGEEVSSRVEALGSPHDFDVDFSGCSEFAGIGPVPLAKARALVPASYTLAGDATSAVLVARAVNCSGVSVDGKKQRPTELSQIGISLFGPDETASINNYTLWFVTNNPELAAKLGAAGVESDHGQVSYQVTTTGSGSKLDVSTAPPHVPAHELHGAVVPPTSAAVPFTASWWFDGRHGTVRMRTVLPNIRFGGATVTLSTPAGSALAQVIGGTSMTFPFLDSYNTFDAAHLEVRNVN